MRTPYKERLFTLLRERAYKKGKFTLRSGLTSDTYFDVEEVTRDCDGLSYIGHVIHHEIVRISTPETVPDFMVGVPFGGYALAYATAVVSAQTKLKLDLLTLRDDRSDPVGDSEGTNSVIVFEDVITTGLSTLKVIERLRKSKWKVLQVIALIDREEGGFDLIRQACVPVLSIFTKRQFEGARS